MAASGWSGFSDAELQRLKLSSDQNERTQSGSANIPAGKMAKKFQYNPTKNPPRQSRPPNGNRALDPAAQLSSPQMSSKQPMRNTAERPRNSAVASGTRPREQNGTVAASAKIENGSQDLLKQVVKKDEKGAATSQAENTESSTAEDTKEDVKLLLDEKKIMSMELANIANFQTQQKAMEELNKQKKLQLMKALEQRRKMAKAEAVKLTDIQKELGHLDALLSSEVSILRDKIEDASIHFMDAQKRYQKAEKEFVESKLDLHAKSDRKEQLTEHLYTIIYQNEVRKARKLGELMEKLEMECSAEELAVSLPPLPQMGMIQTLGPYGAVSPTHSRHSALNPENHDAASSHSSAAVVTQPTTPVISQPTSPAASQLTSPAASQLTSPAASQHTSPAASKSTSPAKETTDLTESSSQRTVENLNDADTKTDVNSANKTLGEGNSVNESVASKSDLSLETGEDKTKGIKLKDLAQNNNSSSGGCEANPVC